MKSKLPRVAVWIDGEPGGDDPRISVFDRGFLYGDSVFETLRTYGGEPFGVSEHLARLEESARRVGMEWTEPLRSLEVEVRRAVFEAGFQEAYVRVMVTRGEGALGLVPLRDQTPRRVILVAPLAAVDEKLYLAGASAISFGVEPRFGLRELAGAKIGNYLIGILALSRAREVQADEALFADSRGFVSEGATSNVFFVQGGTVCTPSEDDGILPGITRSAVLTLSERLGIPVLNKLPTLDDLFSSDEVFVTSTIREVFPIVRIDGRSIGSGAPGTRTLELLRAFRIEARVRASREGRGRPPSGP